MRLVIAISIDGRIALPYDKKASIGGEGDRQVLEEALAWADGTLMGAVTLKTHQSVCLIRQPKLIKKRLSKGKTNQPIALIVGRKIMFSPDWIFFEQPIKRWMITKENESSSSYKKKGYERLIKLQPSWKETLSDIYKEGIHKIALLGGAILASSLLQEDQVDELQLTLSPRLCGGEKAWLTYNTNNLPLNLTQEDSWQLNEVKPLINNEIMLSYYRNR